MRNTLGHEPVVAAALASNVRRQPCLSPWHNAKAERTPLRPGGTRGAIADAARTACQRKTCRRSHARDDRDGRTKTTD
jgi:hypothetical protein